MAAKLGSGARFAKLKRILAAKRGKGGKKIQDPAGLAASIGRNKYGSGKMATLAARGRAGPRKSY